MMIDTLGTMWGSYPLSEEEPSVWTIGNLRLFVRQAGQEVLVADQYSDQNSGAFPPFPSNGADWSRWVLKEGRASVTLLPAFPDRAVVVRPDMPFRLLKGAQTKIYVRVPVWVRISLAGEANYSLRSVPTSILSNTWFGSFEDGELCYWIASGFRRAVSADMTRPDLVICPLRIYNRSDRDFLVEKICLRLDNYSLFYDQVQLWSDEIRVLYKGAENISQVKVVGKPPAESPEAVLVSPPRKEMRKSFAAKTFSSLKELSGLGFPGQG